MHDTEREREGTQEAVPRKQSSRSQPVELPRREWEGSPPMVCGLVVGEGRGVVSPCHSSSLFDAAAAADWGEAEEEEASLVGGEGTTRPESEGRGCGGFQVRDEIGVHTHKPHAHTQHEHTHTGIIIQ